MVVQSTEKDNFTMIRILLLTAVMVAISIRSTANAFIPTTTTKTTFVTNNSAGSRVDRATSTTTATIPTSATRLYYSHSLPDISNMQMEEIKRELESYGISTNTFFEKNDLIQALWKARTEGLQPTDDVQDEEEEYDVNNDHVYNYEQAYSTANGETYSNVNGNGETYSTANGSTTTKTKKTSSSSSSSSAAAQQLRQEYIEAVMQKVEFMKVADLKKELQERGISTKEFIEKIEFVKAYAEAIVDGVEKCTSAYEGEQYPDINDPEYRDVHMEKMPRTDPRLIAGPVIEMSFSVQREAYNPTFIRYQ